MKTYEPVIIEATAKYWKAWIAIGNAMLIIGFTLLVFSAFLASGVTFWLGFTTCILGGIVRTLGNLNAWWDHG